MQNDKLIRFKLNNDYLNLFAVKESLKESIPLKKSHMQQLSLNEVVQV